MTTGAKLNCPACDRLAERLVTHHWYEVPDMTLHEKDICYSCNQILITSKFYGNKFHSDHKSNLTHILPPWEKQLEIIQQVLPGLEAKELRKVKRQEREVWKSTQPQDTQYRDFWIYPDYLGEAEDDMTVTWTIRVDCSSLENAKRAIDDLILSRESRVGKEGHTGDYKA
jgi:hypothetical protein